MKSLIKVGVVRGGPSPEYEVSLNTGANILSAIRKHYEDVYHPRDVFIDRQGNWHIDGVNISPQSALPKVDVIFNALHGTFGEDGKIQSFFERHAMPFTGSDSLGSAVGMNKILTKKILASHGVKSPYWKEITSDKIKNNGKKQAEELFRAFPLPAVVKPTSSGSSVGVSIVRIHKDILPALNLAASCGDSVLIEEFISGTESTCGVIEGFREQKLYALPPIEIVSEKEFFDYEAKYQGKSKEIVPARFSAKIKSALENLSRKVHQALGLRHYSRSDFIINPRRGVYFLEVNTLPGLTNESLLPKSLRAVGSDTHELIKHLIELALR